MATAGKGSSISTSAKEPGQDLKVRIRFGYPPGRWLRKLRDVRALGHFL
jgi:hypothetical protein